MQDELGKGGFRCGKSRCQAFTLIVAGDSLRSNVSGREFKIISTFECYSSGAVYMLGCKVYGKQYAGSTFAPFRARFNKYKSASRRFLKEEVATQAELSALLRC